MADPSSLTPQQLTERLVTSSGRRPLGVSATPPPPPPTPPAFPPWPTGGPGGGPPAPTGPGGAPTPSYPILTEELGYPPSPLAGASGGPSRGGGGRGGSLGPTVTKALQDVLGWKIKTTDSAGFLGALNQSFQLKTVEGAVVSTWTPRSYVVQSDLAGGISGAQASIYTMAQTTLDRMLPLLDGLYPLDPAADIADVAALKQLVESQLTNLAAEIGRLGGPRVMRVHQYFTMLLGVTLRLNLPAGGAAMVTLSTPAPQPPNALAALWLSVPAPPNSWTIPDWVLGSLGDLRDELGLSETVGTDYVNTISDEQNVTNFRIIVDYANSLLNAWTNSIQFFAGASSPFLGTQLVIISRQLGVINEVVDEVRFVLDSVFVGPAQRETLLLTFGDPTLPPIYLEDLLVWIQDFVSGEAQDVIQNGGRLGIGEDFVSMIQQLCTQAYGLYLYAQSAGTALQTMRVQQSLYKLTTQLWDLNNVAAPVGVSYIAPRP
jgi:hypothetical protein